MSKISVFYPITTPKGSVPGTKPRRHQDVLEYLEDIRQGTYEKEVLNYRAGRLKKTELPGVTPSGSFTKRRASEIIAHSGFLALDFDAQDNDVFPADEISVDPYIFALHRSVSGKGWVAYIKIDGNRHLDAFKGAEKYFADEYGVVSDPSCKDISRFRFVSMDAEIVINTKSKTFKKYIAKRKQKPPSYQHIVHTDDDIAYCLQQINERNINLCESYHDWMNIGFALAGKLGENGRNYFHTISSKSNKYEQDKCDKKYSNFLKSASGRVGIGTFFWHCKNAGVRIKTERTAKIEANARMARKRIGGNGGLKNKAEASVSARKTTLEFDRMDDGEDIQEVISQVMNLPDAELHKDNKDEPIIVKVENYLSGFNFMFNEITLQVEWDGEPIDDYKLNSIYRDALKVINSKSHIPKSLFMDVLVSDFVKRYHPLQRFFKENAHIKGTGYIQELMDCIELDELDYNGVKIDIEQHKDIFIGKWLLSCVASWHGTHSVMMLVMIGAQNVGKTKFFRDLLPPSIKDYFAEDKLDQGKDSEILMCKSAIILDDEYAGKSKKDYRKLKQLLSKQVFNIRRPYGKFTERMQRIAVLCGTSNELEILNDPTGNRRILPLPVKRIDYEKFDKIDKDALWMELFHLWEEIKNGWMLTQDEITYLQEIGKPSEMTSLEEESILKFFELPGEGSGHIEYLTTVDIHNHIQANSTLRLQNINALGRALKKLGFVKKSVKTKGVVRKKYGIIKKQSSHEDYPTTM